MAEEKAHTNMTDSVEKNDINSTQLAEDLHVVKKVHADGHVDLVDTHAIGGDVEDMPKGYFWSPQFVGTVVVRLLHACNRYPGTILILAF
jgi:hypothetical protein